MDIDHSDRRVYVSEFRLGTMTFGAASGEDESRGMLDRVVEAVASD